MSKKREIAYHFTGDKLRDGQDVPAIGEWLKHKGPAVLCQSGLHASRTPFQALSFAPGFQLHKVEIDGIVAETDDKLVATKRKIIASLDAKEIILSFARKQALSVIHLYDCPQVLKEWLETGDPAKQKDAANAADAAAGFQRRVNTATAYAAADAAANAVYAAVGFQRRVHTVAAYAAANAVYAAAYAAANAAAAYAAANAVDAAATRQKAEDGFNKMVEEAFAKMV